MADSPIFHFFAGKRTAAARCAELFWAALPERRREHILWDLPAAEKRCALLRLARLSAELAYWSLADRPLGLCWALPLSAGSPALAIHFAFAADGRPWFAALARQYLAQTRASALLALLPAPFAGPAPCLPALGFARIATIPAACHLARYGRTVAGSLWLWLNKKGPSRDEPIGKGDPYG